MFTAKTVKIIFAATTAALLASSAMADTKWQRHHPRREQVNQRLANQNRRIHQERKEGEITGAQARALHANDRSIRAQERADARAHGGHITKREQHQINRELNANSGAIGK